MTATFRLETRTAIESYDLAIPELPRFLPRFPICCTPHPRFHKPRCDLGPPVFPIYVLTLAQRDVPVPEVVLDHTLVVTVVGELLEVAGVSQHVRMMTNRRSRLSWKGHSPIRSAPWRAGFTPADSIMTLQRDLVLQPLDLCPRDARHRLGLRPKTRQGEQAGIFLTRRYTLFV